ncbi:MAG TPA: hypothetical protein DD620_00955, partial [Verrucomicrobia bacterium]|nr:hypothetical protein [Verrucomicrobiota bacterium]
MENNTIHIITILWGKAYDEQDVNRLFAMITNNTSYPICFHLFSDESLPELNPVIIQHSEPRLAAHEQLQHLNYRKEVGLCDNSLGNLHDKRVFFFDLDVIITGNLDEMFIYPKGNEFYIINDWNTEGTHVGQASCYSFVVGTLVFIKEAFELDYTTVVEAYGTASQEYLSAMIMESKGRLNFWPEHWCKSFKYHCLPHPLLRHLRTPKKPDPKTKLLAFHGNPGIEA